MSFLLPSSPRAPALGNSGSRKLIPYSLSRVSFSLGNSMKAILKEKLSIDRPIVFLCGPYYDGKNEHDRRALLRKYFINDLDGKVLPLIIDDFLSDDNLKGFHLELPLLEEILARISRKTFIFLDTISAASEMGLFLNHAFKNKSVVLLPKQSDVIQKQVGVFAQNVISQNANADCLYYRPSITLSTVATGYTSEYYGFINDIIPKDIADYLKNDTDLKGYRDRWSIKKKDDSSETGYIVKLPIRQLFYIVVSIVYDYYLKVLHSSKLCDDSLFNCVEIIRLVKEAIYNYFNDYTNGPLPSKITIETEFSESLDSIVYHMVSFVFIYHLRSSSRGYQIIADNANRSVLYIDGKTPHEVFGLNKEEVELLKKSRLDPEQFFIRKEYVINGKKRELVKYSNDDPGKQIRIIHKKVLKNLKSLYNQHDLSFAYKEGVSIKNCIQTHINNRDFIKYDISKFFNSIDLKILLELFMKEFHINKRYNLLTRDYLENFFPFGKLPLGLVVSPLLSDIYMKDFDFMLEAFCNNNGWIYTRYADDILISSRELFDQNDEDTLDKNLKEQLSTKKLRLNEKKKLHIFLDSEGKSVKYVGIYIVRSFIGNYLSVGKKYINEVAKEILTYYHDRESMISMDQPLENDSNLVYRRKRLIGKIGFLKNIEGERGLQRLADRLKKHMIVDSDMFIK